MVDDNSNRNCNISPIKHVYTSIFRNIKHASTNLVTLRAKTVDTCILQQREKILVSEKTHIIQNVFSLHMVK